MTKFQICQQYNFAIQCVISSIEAYKLGDLVKGQQFLNDAAIKLYECLEWGIKYFVSKETPNMDSTSAEFQTIEKALFRPKLDLVEKISGYTLPSIGIDKELILSAKQVVRNDPEHSGFTTHPPSLYKVFPEVKKFINKFVDQIAVLDELPENCDIVVDDNDSWSDFYCAVDSFQSNRHYVLIIGPEQEAYKHNIKNLGLLKWSLIFDFNSQTEVSGFYKFAADEIEKERKIHLLTSEDSVNILSQFNSVYWIAMNGLVGRVNTQFNTFKEWNRKYTQFLLKFTQKYAQAFGDKPINVVILWDDNSYVLEICKTLDFNLKDKVKFIYALKDPKKIQPIIEHYDGQLIDISMNALFAGINSIKSLFTPHFSKSEIHLSSKDIDSVQLERDTFYWLEEHFEVIYKNFLDIYEPDQKIEELRTNFYKGRQITWLGLKLNHDIVREKTREILRRLSSILSQRPTKIVKISHYPGIGGTTISKRIIWELHKDYPCLVLRKYVYIDTAERIYKVFELTRLPVIVLIENAILNFDDTERLFDEIRSRNFTCLFLIVQRTEENSRGDFDKVFNIENTLTDSELSSFTLNYGELVPQRKAVIETISKSNEVRERHPFYFGLVAFEKEFSGLEKFIFNKLSGSSSIQKRILAIISLCYYYAQRPIPSQMLTPLLGVKENEVVYLERFLGNNLMYLLVNETDNFYRPLHNLVAFEILKQILKGLQDDENSWRHNFTELAIQLIRCISDKSSIPSETEMDILKRLFVFRDDQEMLGKEGLHFSYFIENALQTDEARLTIFKELTKSFPNEPHFWAHLARFYSLKMANLEAALESIEKAIGLSDGPDSLLFHMKGMCLRSKVKQLSTRWNNNKETPELVKKDVQRIADESGESFAECRKINPSNEHGYISHIQLLIETIDFFFTISPYTEKSEFMRSLPYWLHRNLDLAENLLSKMKFITQMREANSYVETCDLKVQAFYGNYSEVLNGWYNQLSKENNDKCIIRRQIVNAYYRRSKDWEQIDKKDINKILTLLEENINENPSDERDIRLWFQAARQIESFEIDSAINKANYWKAINDNDEATYYLSILYAIKTIFGNSSSKIKTTELLHELSQNKRSAPNRTACFEWLGNGRGLNILVPYKQAVIRIENTEKRNDDKLLKVSGKISKIKGPEAGEIELGCGLKAFFVPAHSKGYSRDKDINKDVEFFLGFSFDGIRAFDVLPTKID